MAKEEKEQGFCFLDDEELEKERLAGDEEEELYGEGKKVGGGGGGGKTEKREQKKKERFAMQGSRAALHDAVTRDKGRARIPREEIAKKIKFVDKTKKRS